MQKGNQNWRLKTLLTSKTKWEIAQPRIFRLQACQVEHQNEITNKDLLSCMSSFINIGDDLKRFSYARDMFYV